uniref:plant cysteine oxidase 3 n=1 Tax=Erigeron canadensis TaxID=72917 RepID=UPI001CB9B462|nr:plant cysteine oxidase 3 [Erigeron canadensis]XP_043608701.1 plant cysteine oxidase 3 [Erigeron canadensis]XP_043608702.1 plant cysteine oxidase 3 [Erigeron canadensis]
MTTKIPSSQMLRSSSSNCRRYLSSSSNPLFSKMFFHKLFAMANHSFSSSSNSPKIPSSSSISIQSIYDICKHNLTPSTTPSSSVISQLTSQLDTIGSADVGLTEEHQEDDRGHGFSSPNTLNRVDRWAQPITYVDIHENASFTMCMFCFPTSSVIPLHDHPRMTVLSKVLYGSLHVKAYDWVEPPCIKYSKEITRAPVRLAKLAVDKVLSAPCSTSVLYPKTGGNLHCFTALTSCAVLDILTPSYDESAGRKCSYYRDYPFSSFGSGGERIDGKEDEYAWLEEIQTPDDLYMRSGMYAGPPIQI